MFKSASALFWFPFSFLFQKQKISEGFAVQCSWSTEALITVALNFFFSSVITLNKRVIQLKWSPCCLHISFSTIVCASVSFVNINTHIIPCVSPWTNSKHPCNGSFHSNTLQLFCIMRIHPFKHVYIA